MSICYKFVDGYCPYRDSCFYQHLDIKSMLREDLESSINGNVWPLSAYGPFQLKGNMPNFLEDESFEEVRLRCYETKGLYQVHEFHRQFNSAVLAAKNKMNNMLQMDRNTLSTIITILKKPIEFQPIDPFPASDLCPFVRFQQKQTAGITSSGATGQNNNKSTYTLVRFVFGGTKANAKPENNIFGKLPLLGSTTPSLNCIKQQQKPQSVEQGKSLFNPCASQGTPAKNDEKMKQGKLPPAPEKIMEYLDKHVVGQDFAKKVLAVAVYNHYKRIQLNLLQQEASDQKCPPGLDQLQISGNGFKPKSAPKKEDANAKLEKSNIIMIGPTGSGKTLIAKTIAKFLDVPFATCDVGEDIEIAILKLLQDANKNVERAQTGIVYLDEVDKIGACSKSKCILKLLEGSVVNVSDRKQLFGVTHQVDTTNILIVASGAYKGLNEIIVRRLNEKGSTSPDTEQVKRDSILTKVRAQDLVKFGMSPEFIGRFPVIVPFHSLDVGMLVRILTEPSSALVTQYKTLLDLDNVALTFTKEAIEAIAQLAMETNTGAWGLRSIMEQLLSDPMFSVPGSDIRGVHITADYVKGKSTPEYRRDTDAPDSMTIPPTSVTKTNKNIKDDEK
ncbi:ATP-dependent Clp protease ATP-binding subunit clpX-like, mitochondrial [Drosophila elegans]|uniref:ATP-dependent Clp protease ATP-binding subunit clpX-like, mitochondrial n=1 Tax=Drosophila elegans TaxID=30023 RepID=UPI0007E61468|nr:ATP-dependent Clp protease ATP-binding subunit clpX-like, mitochondrial [Drosophila elegans]